jgi:2'-5' RNA ligase
MKRTFIAIDIIPSVKLKEDYELVRHRLRLERISWVPEKNLHFTLNFLGDTAEELLADIVQGIENLTKRTTSFCLTLRSFGVFKNLHDPRVIWIGCDPCPEIELIKKELDNTLTILGLEPENRTFSPHITLGRVKNIHQQNQLAQLITMHKDTLFQSQKVDKIILYESKPTAAGATYLPIEEFFLK